MKKLCLMAAALAVLAPKLCLAEPQASAALNKSGLYINCPNGRVPVDRRNNTYYLRGTTIPFLGCDGMDDGAIKSNEGVLQASFQVSADKRRVCRNETYYWCPNGRVPVDLCRGTYYLRGTDILFLGCDGMDDGD